MFNKHKCAGKLSTLVTWCILTDVKKHKLDTFGSGTKRTKTLQAKQVSRLLTSAFEVKAGEFGFALCNCDQGYSKHVFHHLENIVSDPQEKTSCLIQFVHFDSDSSAELQTHDNFFDIKSKSIKAHESPKSGLSCCSTEQ